MVNLCVEKEEREETFVKLTLLSDIMRLIHTLQARASCIGSRHREGITEFDRFYMHQRRDWGDFLSFFPFFFSFLGGIVLNGTFVTPRFLSRACIPLVRAEESRL